MIEARTEELTGAALDWAVAKACNDKPFPDDVRACGFAPSIDWSHAGPLLLRFLMDLSVYDDQAEAQATDPDTGRHYVLFADDALTAICRAVVRVMLGPTVQIPNSLGGWLTRPE